MCGAEDHPDELTSPASPALSRRMLLAALGVSAGAMALGIDLSLSPGSAAAAGSYLRPCGAVPISSSWQGHKNRTPPSGEPGTDYDVAYGTPVYAATNGSIVDRKDTTSSATGRFLALQADDGNYIRYLHLKSSLVGVNQTVSRGQLIAYSGASGFGSENGYGAHVHVSLWIGGSPFQLGFTNTVDFENYVGNANPQPTPDPSIIHRRNNNMTSFYYKTEGGAVFALAGDSPGTSANWIETSVQSFANQLAGQHGTAALLSQDTFNSFKARYLENIN